tara:strand:+ start:524 stop:2497 length:1974 start_codon:yes stop_codon:yes gene_type:complete
MPDRWQTYPIEFEGGLITNLSPLQHGLKAPGSARVLRNYEPSVEGGYRRIKGFDKYDSNIVPPYGAPVVHGGSQSGTTLIIGNIHKTPEAGDTLTITGVSGTYTIASSGVSYDATNNRATLTLTTSLDSSPANAAAVTFVTTTTSHLINGIASWEDSVIVSRNDDLFRTTGSGYTHINVPSYGTVLVNGASQTGTSLVVDGLSAAPQAGDVFKIAGVDLVYTVTADATVSSGGATLAINPALASSPADDAAITFLSTSRDGTVKVRSARYNFSGTEKIVLVDGANAPANYDTTTFTVLDAAPSDAVGATHVAVFKNHLFFAKGSNIAFTAPFSDSDFSAASGGGVINSGNAITGLIVFREQLIIFSERRISRLVGNSVSDFQLQPITMDVGCTQTDTIQEVGGDVFFVGPDGIRSVGSTAKIGDFDLATISKPIQAEVTNFVNRNTSFSSIVIREKSQYRLFGFNANITRDAAQGILGTQTQQGINWAELRGIRAHVADSNYNGSTELIVFAHNDGYVYQLESANTFDGANVPATFSTPFMPINDPRVRKTFYRMFLYTDPQGSVALDVALKYDFEEEGIIQPAEINFNNTSGSDAIALYGDATFGTGTYGGTVKRLFDSQTVGSGFVVSLVFTSESTNAPYSLDALTLEYGTYGRR